MRSIGLSRFPHNLSSPILTVHSEGAVIADIFQHLMISRIAYKYAEFASFGKRHTKL